MFCYNRVLALAGIVLIGSLTALPALAQQSLFSATPPPVDQSLEQRWDDVLRGDYVTVRFDVLRTVADPLLSADRVVLTLLDGVSVTAVEQRVDWMAPDRYVWVGTVEGVPGSEVSLVSNRGVLVGDVTMGGQSYLIRPVRENKHLVFEVDRSAFPEVEDVILEPSGNTTPAPRQQGNGKAAMVENIDLMIVYTAAARTQAGGLEALEAIIMGGVGRMNTAFINSGLSHTVTLVDVREVVYTETGSSTDVQRLQNPSDGHMDEVHMWRADVGADMVGMVVSTAYPFCGVAYNINDPIGNPNAAANAFNLTIWNCVDGNRSLAHEFGHNMGMRHDPFVDGSLTPDPYNHGYTNPVVGNTFRTIMAYNNACSSVGLSCPRLSYFSDPNLTLNGDVMGTEDLSNNARAFNERAAAIAAFVPAVAGPSFNITLKKLIRTAGGTKKAKIKWTSTDIGKNKVDFYIDRAPDGNPDKRTRNDGAVKLKITFPGDGPFDIIACEKKSTTFCSNTLTADFTGVSISLDEPEEDDETDGFAAKGAATDETPPAFALRGNYPNPFNPVTSIRLDLPEAAQVQVSVFDLLGRQVLTPAAVWLSAGSSRSVAVDASSLPSGTYVYRVTARMAETVEVGTGRMVLVK